MHGMMLNVAKELNLAPHYIFGKELAMCADVEVHKNEDNYIVLGKVMIGSCNSILTPLRLGKNLSPRASKHSVAIIVCAAPS